MLTIFGRLTADPEIRFIQSGGAVASFTVAHNSRKFNRSKNEWEDSEPTFYRCSLWGTAAENLVNTLRKGHAVIVHGAYGSRSWESNGERKTAQEVRVEKIGLDLGFYSIDPNNIVNSSGRGGQRSAPAQNQPDVSAPGGSDNDPWASSPSSAEPPF